MNEISEKTKNLFVEALCAAVHGRQVDWAEGITAQQLDDLMQLAEVQFVLPMVLQAIYNCPAVKALGQWGAVWRSRSRFLVGLQARKTEGFLRLYRALGEKGLQPLVVKGLICRSLYPQPDTRSSSDEDLLIPPEAFPAYHQALTECGMVLREPDQDIYAQYEVPYCAASDPTLYIELHKQLFSPESKAYGALNRYFDRAVERSVETEVSGVAIRTLCPTDHLLYLLLHAYKHFLHSGFGLRQLCDICRYTQVWGGGIDWPWLLQELDTLKLYRFFASLLKIGRDDLGYDFSDCGLPANIPDEAPDTAALLNDLLEAGIYGQGSMSRKHSSTITLGAAERARGGSGGVLRTVFPTAKALEHRYPYLAEKPWLLPAAWADRLVKYRRETRGAGAGNNAAESLRIGNERIALLKEYGILD